MKANQAQHASAVEPIEFCDYPETRTITKYSKSSIARGVKAGTFPKPVKLSPRKNVWLRSELHAWMQAQVAAR